MRRLAVIGYPVKHSISPAMHQAALDELGIDAEYVSVEVSPEDLAAFVGELRVGEWAGINVTVPHKEKIVPLLDELAPSAAAIGAVNTVVVDGDRLIGHNTDAAGFARALHEDGGFDPGGKTVVLLGAGGAARAVTWSLCEGRTRNLLIVSRGTERASALAATAAGWGGWTQVESQPWPAGGPEWEKALENCDLLVNATPVGLNPAESPLPVDAIPDEAVVMDLIYNPRPTRLLAEAGVRLKTIDGLSMLVYQGAAAFNLWTGLSAPVQTMMDAAEHALEAAGTRHTRETRVGDLLATPLANPVTRREREPVIVHHKLQRRRRGPHA